MYLIANTDPLQVWPGAEALLKDPSKDLIALNPGGPEGLTTWSRVYETAEDPCRVPGCILCLEKWVDGSPISVRHRITEVMTKDYYDLHIKGIY